MTDIAARVSRIISQHLGVQPEAITDEARIIDDLGADSLDTIELVMAFDEEFGIEIPDATAEEINTVGDAIRHITTLTA